MKQFDDLHVELTFIIAGETHVMAAPIWMRLSKVRDLALAQTGNRTGAAPWVIRDTLGVLMPPEQKVDRLFPKPTSLYLMPSVGAGGCV
jgi:hypothetical protein